MRCTNSLCPKTGPVSALGSWAPCGVLPDTRDSVCPGPRATPGSPRYRMTWAHAVAAGPPRRKDVIVRDSSTDPGRRDLRAVTQRCWGRRTVTGPPGEDARAPRALPRPSAPRGFHPELS